MEFLGVMVKQRYGNPGESLGMLISPKTSEAFRTSAVPGVWRIWLRFAMLAPSVF